MKENVNICAATRVTREKAMCNTKGEFPNNKQQKFPCINPNLDRVHTLTLLLLIFGKISFCVARCNHTYYSSRRVLLLFFPHYFCKFLCGSVTPGLEPIESSHTLLTRNSNCKYLCNIFERKFMTEIS